MAHTSVNCYGSKNGQNWQHLSLSNTNRLLCDISSQSVNVVSSTSSPLITMGSLRDPETLIRNNISAFGDQRVCELTRVSGGSFEGTTIDPFVWSQSVTNSGSLTMDNGFIELKCTTASGDLAMIQSLNPARFQSAFANQLLCGIFLSDISAQNVTRRWGAFDSSNGFFYELKDGTFKIAVRKNAVDSYITSFNGNFGASGPVINTNSTGYEIHYHGGRQFFLTRGTLIHAISPTNTTTVASLNLRSRFECFTTSGATVEPKLSIVASAINRAAGVQSRPSFYNISTAGTNTLRRGTGTLHSIIVNAIGSPASSIKIYDSVTAAGSTIATIDTNKTTISTLAYDLDFYNGLTVVTTGTFGDITVTWD